MLDSVLLRNVNMMRAAVLTQDLRKHWATTAALTIENYSSIRPLGLTGRIRYFPSGSSPLDPSAPPISQH